MRVGERYAVVGSVVCLSVICLEDFFIDSEYRLKRLLGIDSARQNIVRAIAFSAVDGALKSRSEKSYIGFLRDRQCGLAVCRIVVVKQYGTFFGHLYDVIFLRFMELFETFLRRYSVGGIVGLIQSRFLGQLSRLFGTDTEESRNRALVFFTDYGDA